MMRRLAAITGLALLAVACTRSEPKTSATVDQPSASHKTAAAVEPPQPAPQSPKDGSMLGSKPYFTLHIESESVFVEVYVNGGFVVTDLTGNPTRETWPVNQLLTSGPNEIAVLIAPWAAEEGKPAHFDENAVVTLTLRARASGVEDSEEVSVSTLKVHCAAVEGREFLAGSTEPGRFASDAKLERRPDGDVKVDAARIDRSDPEGTILVTQTVSMVLPFPRWAFLQSEGMPAAHVRSRADKMADYEGLLAAYQEIWSRLAGRDFDGLMPLFEERNRENDQAFYFPPGTTQRKLRKAFETAVTNPSRKLMDVNPGANRFWTYDPAPGGKLRRLVVGDRATPIIRFADKEDSSFATVFAIAFRKQDGRYIVSR